MLFYDLVPGLAIIVSEGCVSCTVHAFTCAISLGGVFSGDLVWCKNSAHCYAFIHT